MSLVLASAVVNCQSMVVWVALRWLAQAATSERNRSMSGILRARHWRARTLSSHSAMLSQLACLGV